MDQITLDRLKAAGFDDNDIAEYAKAHTTDNGPVNPSQAQPNEMPSVPFDPNNVPSTTAPLNTTTQNAGEGLAAVNSIIGSPLGHAVEGGGALAALGKIFANRGATPPTAPAPVAPPAAPVTPPKPLIQVPQNVGSGPRPMPGMTPPAAQPPVGGPAAQQGTNFIQRMAGLAEQYAPLLRGAGVVAAGMAPATLNKNEDQLLQEKHRLEMQMLLNKHSSEWNKYKNAQQATQGQ